MLHADEVYTLAGS